MAALRYTWIAISFWFCLYSLPATASESNLEDMFFRTISPRGGFTDKGVEEIVQDHLGFIWIATRDGLYRYDGYEFRKYVHSAMDSSSLSNDGIRDLLIDNQNRFWIATVEGLNLYNRAKDGFEHVHPENLNSPISIADLETDPEGHLYIGAQKSILRYNHANGRSKMYELPFGDIRKIQISREGLLLVAFVEHGIYQVPEYGEPELIVPARESSLRAFLLADSTMYLGYETEGIIIHNSQGKQITSLTVQNGKISHNKINKIYQDSEDNIWIGSYLGVDIIEKNGHMHRYSHNILDPYSIPNSSVYGIYEDPANNFWIGTWSGGLAYYNRYDNKFEYFKQEPGINSVSNNYISCFTVDKGGDLWIGTERGGLNRKYASDKRYELTRVIDENPELLNIKSLLITSENKIFIGTYKAGFHFLDQNRMPHRIYLDGISPGDERVYALQESDSGIWVGDFSNGLYHISKSDYTRQVNIGERPDSMGLTSSKVTTLFINNGDLWVGTNNGLNLKPEGKSYFIKFLNDKNDPTSLSSNIITMLARDLEGNIWIGTRRGGLNKFLENDRSFINYTMNDGLSGDDANGILCDASGYLWISSENGISRFDPADGSIKNYNESDGLQGKQFNMGSAFKGEDGTLYFGGTNGYNIIKPEQIKSNPVKPVPVISRLLVNNQIILASGQNSILQSSISETSALNLKHDQSSIAFQFITNNYLNPSKNRFAYRLIGLDEVWQYGFQNEVSYANLDPGQYRFELRAANNDGIWSNDPVSLDIKINPPWWNHYLAIIFYSIIGLIALILTRNMILYRERMNSAIKLETLKRENEENIHNLKLQFFTNISHEFKTPLTLILSPIQRLVRDSRIQPEIKEDLLLAEKNANRLKKLVNQFIEFRKIDQIKLKLHVSEVDIIDLSEDIFSCFSELAEKSKIDYSFYQEIEPVDLWVDIEKMENAIFNVLSNAFKYTHEGGQIQFSIRKGPIQLPESWPSIQFGDGWDTDSIFLEISDTGSGINKEELNKIFERFYRSEKTNIQSGSGIGLSLAKEYTLLHKGSITVASMPGEGSTFIFGIRTGIEHFKQLDNVEYCSNQARTVLKRELDLPGESIGISPEIQEDENADKPLLLLIEDNIELNQYLVKILSEQYRVVKSLNGTEGYSLASRLLPELIISDVMLPGLDGLELCEKIKTDPLTSHIPVILITALSEDDQRIEGIDRGADAYLTKPVDLQLLASTINNLIEARKKLRLSYGGIQAATNREEGLTTFDATFLRRAKMYIEKNITNPDIPTTQLASELNMSRTNLHRKLKSLTGQSSTEFIRSIRINKAMDLMEKEGLSIGEVCYAVGFTSSSYFSKCFKEIYGINPSAFRKNLDMAE